MADKDEAEAELAANHLRVCQRTGLLVCSKEPSCRVGIRLLRKPVWHHLRKYHGMDREEFRKMLKNAEALIPFAPDAELLEKYEKGGAQWGPLPRVDGIEVMQGKKCFECDKIFIKDVTLRTHLGREHKGHGKSEEDIASLSARPCQSISGPGRCAFFVNETAGEGGAEAEEMEEYDPGAVVEGSDEPVDEYFLSGFVSVGKLVYRLKACGLTLEKASLILGGTSPWSDEGFRKKMKAVKKSLRCLLQEARRVTNTNGESHSLLWVIQTSGIKGKDRMFQFLKDGNEAGEGDDVEPEMEVHDTLRRYVDHAALVVRIACVVWRRKVDLEGVNMSAEVEQASKAVVEKNEEEDEAGFTELVYKLLWIIFTEDTTATGAEGVYAFGYTVVACLCVQVEGIGRGRFARGVSVGSKMAGILYAASCIFALHIFKNQGQDSYRLARDRIESINKPDSMSAVHYMTDMRAIAASLREEEAKLNPFEKCETHTNCGIFAGHEFSAERYGQAVRKMHEKIKEKMFKELLKEKKLPDGFWTEASSIAEDTNNPVSTYWALSDPRNKEFVNKCQNWAWKAADLPGLREYGWEMWRKTAEDVLLDLLTAVHITGGGPARGTELGSLTIRNARLVGRSVFFLRDEVMLLPCYSKMRSQRRGKILFVSRHVDRETSRLLRSFFLLVYPLLVLQLEWEERKMKEAGERTREKKKAVIKMRQHLTLGRWSPKKMAEKIGIKLISYGIPFTFSQFRHHQRGLAKGKNANSLLRMVAEATEAAPEGGGGGAGEGVGDPEDANIEQGGHTVRAARAFYAHAAKLGELNLPPSADKIKMFRIASQEWHIDLGLRGTKKEEGKKEDGEKKKQYPIGKGMVDKGVAASSPSMGQVGDAQGGVHAKKALTGMLLKNPRLAELLEGKSEAELIDRLAGPCSQRTLTESRGVPLLAEEVRVEKSVEEQGGQDGDLVMVPCESEKDEGCAMSQSIGGETMGKAEGGVTCPGKMLVPSPETVQSRNARKISQEGVCPPPQPDFGLRLSENHELGPVPMEIEDECVMTEQQSGENRVQPEQTAPEYCRKVRPPPARVVSSKHRGEEDDKVTAPANPAPRGKKRPASLSTRNPKPLAKIWRKTLGLPDTRTASQSPSAAREEKGVVEKGKQSRGSSVTMRVISDGGAGPLSSRVVEKGKQSRSPSVTMRVIADGGAGPSPSGKSGEGKVKKGKKRSKACDDVAMTLMPSSQALQEEEEVYDDFLDYVNGVDSKTPRDVIDASVGSRDQVYESKVVNGHFNALAALRQVTYKQAVFKSDVQRKAMEAVALRRGDLAIILRTGEGKTAVVMGPVTQEKGVTVWIVPLRALRWETEERLQRGGLEVYNMKTMTMSRAGNGVGVVLVVSPEDAVQPRFKEIMQRLHEAQVLNRVVVDEAHLAVLAESYRSCMTQLATVAKYGTLCPVVMLTATAPPSLMERIADSCGSNSKGLEVLRGDPCRGNLTLSVDCMGDEEVDVLYDETESRVERHILEAEYTRAVPARILVVCLTIEDSVRIHERCSKRYGAERALLYNGCLEEYERSQVMKKWKSKLKEWTIVVATDGFCTGTDAPDVRLVLFAGASRNLVDFWQGAGRGGRDGSPANVVVLYHRSHLKRANGGKLESTCDAAGVGDFAAWAEDEGSCRRVGIERCLTGHSNVPSCEDRSKGGDNVSICDVCMQEKRKRIGKTRVWGSRGIGEEKGQGTFVQEERSIPSDADLKQARVEQHDRAKLALRERLWLRRVGYNLRKMCLDHVLGLYEKSSIVASRPKEKVQQMIARCESCPGNCTGVKNRCYRCQEPGEIAKNCKVFTSIYYDRRTGRRNGNGQCRECRLVVVLGENPHEANEFGHGDNCFLKYCLHILMRAWTVPKIREDMQGEGGGIAWGRGVPVPRTRKEFAVWLTEEIGTKTAGIHIALHWLCERLPFDLAKL